MVGTSARSPFNSAAPRHGRRRTRRFDIGGLRSRIFADRRGSVARALFRDPSAKVRGEGARCASLRAILANLWHRAELIARQHLTRQSTVRRDLGGRDLRGFDGRGIPLGSRFVRARGGKYNAARALASAIVLLRRASRGQTRVRVRREMFAVVTGIGDVHPASGGRYGIVVARRARAWQSIGVSGRRTLRRPFRRCRCEEYVPSLKAKATAGDTRRQRRRGRAGWCRRRCRRRRIRFARVPTAYHTNTARVGGGGGARRHSHGLGGHRVAVANRDFGAHEPRRHFGAVARIILTSVHLVSLSVSLRHLVIHHRPLSFQSILPRERIQATCLFHLRLLFLLHPEETTMPIRPRFLIFDPRTSKTNLI